MPAAKPPLLRFDTALRLTFHGLRPAHFLTVRNRVREHFPTLTDFREPSATQRGREDQVFLGLEVVHAPTEEAAEEQVSSMLRGAARDFRGLPRCTALTASFLLLDRLRPDREARRNHLPQTLPLELP